ncbi:SCO7613 C-terminal domain-containing membrane protein [Motilibacter deserti]|uniref:Membrane protein DUF2157 n=1 Tax=Motilibacter deserti TaxID=2714956 RepID=A0ABX0GYJ7_9ACTN|nr:hypothetical protein [Motilibacter deserti]NHC14669.1 hypothetical protein [Motilibacter deserti]
MIDASAIEALTDPGRCPDCAAGLPSGPSRCPRCGLPLQGDAAVQVWELSLRAAAALTARRDALAVLRRAVPAPVAPSAPAPAAPSAPAPAAGAERSGRGVQRLLVGLGALLLAVAAVIFAVVSWDLVGVGGRGLILAGATAAVVAVTELARARRLPVTAEALSAVAVVLAVLDGWAAYRVGLAGVDAVGGARYALTVSVLLAVLSLSWARLRPAVVPEAAAVLLGAAAVVSAAVDLQPSAGGTGSALALAAGGTALLAPALRGALRSGAARVAALGAGSLLWGQGVLMVTVGGFVDGTAGPVAVLAVAAVLAAGLAALAPRGGLASTVAAGSSTGAVLLAAAVAAFALGGFDLLVPATIAACALVAVVAWLVPAPLRRAPLAVAAAATGLAALPSCYALLAALTATADATAWSATPGQGYADVIAPTLDAGLPWSRPLEALLAGAVLALLARTARLPLAGLPLPLGAAVAAVLGLAAWNLPLAAAPVLTAAAAAALVAALVARPRSATAYAAGAALVATGPAAALTPGTTVAALAVVLAAALVAARVVAATLRPHALAVATAAAGALALTTPPAAGTTAAVAGLGALLVATLAAVAARALAAQPERLAVEAAAAAVALAGLAAAGTQAAYLSPALALAAAGLGAVAVRADRRNLAWPALGAALLAVESRLAYAGVQAVEPYTLPVAAALLAAGVLARHRAPQTVGSWLAYGPGLLLGFVPSLALVGGSGAARPVVLALAAFATLVVGLQRKLQAPLLVGAGVLAVDAVAQLAPYAPAVPRWAVLGLLGVALLLLGATYERRVAQLRTAARALATFG